MESELEGGNNMKKTRVTWAIVIAIAGLLVSVTSLSVNITQNRYNIRGVDSSSQWKTGFTKKSNCLCNRNKEALDKGQCEVWCEPNFWNC